MDVRPGKEEGEGEGKAKEREEERGQEVDGEGGHRVDGQAGLPCHGVDGQAVAIEVRRPLHQHCHQHQGWAQQQQAREDMADDEVSASLPLFPLLKVWSCRGQLGVPKVGQRVPGVTHRGQ